MNRSTLNCAIIILCLFVSIPSLVGQTVSAQIKLNQLGFYPNGPKTAVITGPVSTTEFYIVSTNLRDTFFSGRLSEEKQSAYSPARTRIADFSPLQQTGSFVLLINGTGHSYVFQIGDHVHRDLGIAVLKGYYYQRASMPLDEKYAGRWHRSAGHPDTVVYIHSSAASDLRPAGSVISSPGGWYDAGDYNKYIVNSGISMGTLLSAFEDFPEYFSQLQSNIPETGNGVPDILNELLYNLRWMLTMQDSGDGGVYHKCTNAAFDGMVMPGITKTPRLVVQKGTAATLDFAAVTAQAARIFALYKKKLPGLSDSCLDAAKKAWQWCLMHPSVIYDQEKMNQIFQPAITTGAYGDQKFNDEWLWAAAELFVTTKEEKFYSTLNQYMNETVSLPSWNNVALLGYYSIIRNKKLLPLSATGIVGRMEDSVIRLAKEYTGNVAANAFQTVMGQSKRDFIWGSNSVAANQGIVLINAYLLTKDKRYVDHALSNLDYLLGRNATGYCFVTGSGSRSPMFPHHRPSTADGITDPVPGLLAGGPNPGMQDKCKYEFTDPETAYTDIVCAYACNEIAINWNAPLVYLANAIEALKGKVGYMLVKK